MSDDLEGLGSISTILRTKPDMATAIELGLMPSAMLLSYNGSVQQIRNFTEDAPRLVSYMFHNMTKAEERELLDFWAARQGMLEKFWAPGHRTAFKLSQTMPAGSTGLYVKSNDFDRIYRGYERIYLELTNGDLITRKIISVSSGPGADELTLQLDVITDREISPAAIEIFGRLYLVRFAKDRLEFEHGANWESKVKIELQELVKEYPS